VYNFFYYTETAIYVYNLFYYTERDC